MDLLVFVITNWSIYKQCICNAHVAKDINGPKKDHSSFFKRAKRKFGCKLVGDKKKSNTEINKALMLEVLAYTTDGIAQVCFL